MPQIIKTVCSHDCPDACSVLVTVDDSSETPRAVQFRGDPKHPFTRGFLCGKVNNYEEVVYSEDRLLYPQRRVGPKGEARFERISWDEATREIAAKLRAVQQHRSGEAILNYYYAGTMGAVQRFSPEALFNRLGATQLRQNICFYGTDEGYRLTVGSGYGLDPEDSIHSDLILVWGCNVVTTQVHLVPFLDAARKNGARLIAIDPYRNRTVRKADEWIQVKPGTDTALALGLMHVIVNEGLLDEDFIARRTIGFDRLREEVLPKYTPERTAEISGINPEQIVELARRIAAARAPLVKLGIGLGRTSHGAASARAICCLAGVVGAYEKLGGGVLYDSGCEFRLNLDAVKRPDWLETPGDVPTPREMNMTDLGIALTEWSDPPIDFLYVHGANPAATAPLQSRVIDGLKRDDLFTVVHERFLTDTARYADIVLPAPTFAESSDLFKSYGHLYLQYGRQAVPALGESRSNLEVVQALGKELGEDDPWFERSVEDHVREILKTDHPNFEGVDADKVLAGETFRLNLPRGKSGFRERFATPTGKLEFASEELAAQGHPDVVVDFKGDPFDTDPERYPLRLLTPPAHAFLNASFGSSPRSVKREGDEPSLWIHPDDADDIADGDEIETYNELGRIRILARVTDETRPGTVIAEGTWWPAHGRDGKGINVLTSNRLTDLGGGSTFHDNRVAIRRV